MFFNYIKILFRNFIRNKTFSIINVLGLSAGLTCFLLIGLYVADEYSFDRHHKNLDRIYMVITEAGRDGESQKWNGVANRVATTVEKEIPEVEKATRIFPHEFGNLAFVSTDTVKSTEDFVAWADPNVFDVITIPFIKGDPRTSLTRPNTAVVSEDAAMKYFGTTDVIGKTIKIDRTDLEITGVYENPPHNSRFQHPIIGSFNSHWFGKEKSQSWSNASFETFLLVQPGVDPATIEKKMQEMIDRNIEKSNQWYTLKLMALKDSYIYSNDIQDFANPNSAKGDIQQIKILVGLGMIVLLIASVNYMNLSTAQSQRRYKEIGISKTLGATAKQLARQFYTETSVFVLIAMLISIVLAGLFMPVFNSVTGKFLSTAFIGNGLFWAAFIFTWMILSLISGFYPAIYLSSFSPKRILKSSAPGVGGNSSVRKGLVVVQFTVSITLIISTVILYQQLNYIRAKKLGYEPEQTVAILTSGAQNKEQIASLREEINRLPFVVKTGRSQSFPGAGASGRNLRPLNGEGEGKSLSTVQATSEILDVLGIKLLAGKTLPENKAAEDTTIQVVLNKTSVDFLGLSPEETVNRIVDIGGFGKVEVVGITEDFHFSSLHQPIGAYCFHNAKTEGYNYIIVKLGTGDLPGSMKQLEATYRKIIPSAFEFVFLDQRLSSLYKTDQQLAQVILIFASLAIFIACLGLYALAAYTTEQRTKEIGIRKVLGASVIQLTNMLSIDFIKLVVISFLMAAPVAYYFMSEWLKSFAYRIEINLLILLAAGLASVLIAWVTVGLESIKAAFTNPVNSLRNE